MIFFFFESLSTCSTAKLGFDAFFAILQSFGAKEQNNTLLTMSLIIFFTKEKEN